MKVTKMDLEIAGCPMLWTCELDGKAAYIRYRWGYLALRLDEGKGFNNSEVIGKQIGDEFDGIIEEGRVIEWLENNDIEIE